MARKNRKRSQPPAHLSQHYLVVNVMKNARRTLSGSTWCCLAPPGMDLREHARADVAGRKVQFFANTDRGALLQQDDVIFQSLGDMPPGMIVLVVLDQGLGNKWNPTDLVQMIGPDFPRVASTHR